ncbi:hypothetical protein SpCBS45565_g01441 [Spizellomyces sp. 'palustris']|nr:hypothetical protein SpCBS45565_g01441 [Spizellomyces sp. 'palustris']
MADAHGQEAARSETERSNLAQIRETSVVDVPPSINPNHNAPYSHIIFPMSSSSTQEGKGKGKGKTPGPTPSADDEPGIALLYADFGDEEEEDDEEFELQEEDASEDEDFDSEEDEEAEPSKGNHDVSSKAETPATDPEDEHEQPDEEIADEVAELFQEAEEMGDGGDMVSGLRSGRVKSKTGVVHGKPEGGSSSNGTQKRTRQDVDEGQGETKKVKGAEA